MNQRDVPGTTRAALPTLVANGIIGISVGVNGASTPPNVPPAFVWHDEASGAEVLALWHPFGYGGTGIADAVIVPGLSHALVFEWNGDNAGPPDVASIESTWAALHSLFPGAKVGDTRACAPCDVAR